MIMMGSQHIYKEENKNKIIKYCFRKEGANKKASDCRN